MLAHCTEDADVCLDFCFFTSPEKPPCPSGLSLLVFTISPVFSTLRPHHFISLSIQCRPSDEAVCTGDPMEMWEQCGGTGFEGSTCCVDGTECVVLAPCYSEVREEKPNLEDKETHACIPRFDTQKY